MCRREPRASVGVVRVARRVGVVEGSEEVVDAVLAGEAVRGVWVEWGRRVVVAVVVVVVVLRARVGLRLAVVVGVVRRGVERSAAPWQGLEVVGSGVEAVVPAVHHLVAVVLTAPTAPATPPAHSPRHHHVPPAPYSCRPPDHPPPTPTVLPAARTTVGAHLLLLPPADNHTCHTACLPGGCDPG